MPMTESTVYHEVRPEVNAYVNIITALMKRIIQQAGAPAALRISRRIPELVIDGEGNVVSYDAERLTGAVMEVIDQWADLYAQMSMPLMQQTIHILLVDDHALVREGLVGLIEPQPDMKVVGEAGTVREAIALARQLRPDLILLDISLPDGTGQDVAHAVLAEHSTAKIVFLTVHDEDDLLLTAISSGAVGYLLKSVHAVDLLARLRAAARGDVAISPDIARRLLDVLARLPARQPAEAVIGGLTEREIEVLNELAHGSSNREIAQKLIISEYTVKNHIHNILQKLRLRSREDAAEYASTHQLKATVRNST